MSQPTVRIVAPLAGDVIDLTEVPDPVFASKKMGDGFGVVPSSGAVVSPASGKVMMIAKTGHAFAIVTPEGVEVLVHMGIDTVELAGAPFALTLEKGQTIAVGDTVGTMDLAAIEAAGKSTTTMVIFTNLTRKKGSVEVTTGTAALGADVATVTIPEKVDAPAAAETAGPAASTPAVGATKPLSDSKFDVLAARIVDAVGGTPNIKSVLHCITRVRFYLADDTIPNDKEIADFPGVIDVMRAGGQYQVVIGAEVEDVYDAITKLTGGGAGGESGATEEVERPTTAWGWVKYGFSSLIGVITGSMIPVIGLLAASGILKGILALLTQFNVVKDASDTYILIDAMSSSMFYFLPIIIGFTAARRLGSDPIIVAIIGGVLVFPSVVTMSNPKSDTYHVVATLGPTVFNGEFFGIPIALPQGNAYAYSIFPIIVAAWLAARIEPLLKKYIPAVIRMIFAPLLEVFIVSTLVLVFFGPIIMIISGGISNGVNSLLGLNYTIAGLLIGGFYQCLVIFGLHWAVIPLISQQIAQDGSSHLNAIVSATMIAQGGGALAIWIKTKSLKIKELAGPATISAMCGITEPAMYGLNLKYGRVFITASIGGAVGGLLTGLFNVNMYGFTGAFVGFPSFISKNGDSSGNFIGFLIASFAALIVSFTLTYFFGYSDADLDAEKTVKKVRLGRRDPVA